MLHYETEQYQEAVVDFTELIAHSANGTNYYYRGLANIYMLDLDNGCEDLSISGELGMEEAYVQIKKHCN